MRFQPVFQDPIMHIYSYNPAVYDHDNFVISHTNPGWSYNSHTLSTSCWMFCFNGKEITKQHNFIATIKLANSWSTVNTCARLTLLYKAINKILIEYMSTPSSSIIARVQHTLKSLHYYIYTYRYSFFMQKVSQSVLLSPS